MHYKKLLACASAATIALAIGCSKHAETPVSPTTAEPGQVDATPDGSTLKATAPVPVSPINGAQPDTSVVLIAQKSQGKFVAFPVSYQFQIRSGSTIAFDSGVVGGSGNGPDQVAYTPSVALTPDAIYTWRVRAAYAGAYGPWSADATFKAPAGGYIRGNELSDPLTTGKTVGTIVGPVEFTPDGAKLLASESRITYVLPQTITAGEFSLMVKGADEGAPGGKSKIFSMQQGFDDITTNKYRFTGELRGRDYSPPGTVSCRMIAGDGVSRDCDPRKTLNFDSTRWYFWKVSWNVGGSFTMEVHLDGPGGPTLASWTRSLGGRTFQPNPHVLHLGAPVGRGGILDATLPGGTYKNVWASPNARPAFPGE